MAETPTFGRYAEIPYDQMTPEQQDGFRSLMEARGRLPAPNLIYVHNPGLAKVMGPLGAYFRTGYSLSEREREIAVCIINSKFHSGYPTSSHERAAKAAGLPNEKVEAILTGLPQVQIVVNREATARVHGKRPRTYVRYRSIATMTRTTRSATSVRSINCVRRRADTTSTFCTRIACGRRRRNWLMAFRSHRVSRRINHSNATSISVAMAPRPAARTSVPGA